IYVDNTWYYLRSSGAMVTGWFQVNGKWYYAYSSGALAVNTTVGGYQVNYNGEWVQ
ncbi:N-acetylmuramoyl-L-alanine amidase family protein, partial [Streptococcus pneumoniae]|nr:N-acetylmuramoyl-L-alanine amidase family protein [Streptococcus pneumoniae]